VQATKKSATLMTVNSLANLPYNAYPQVEFSTKPFFNIAGYGSNSYNGKIKSYNEDMAKTIINYQKKMVVNNQTYQPNISYFGVFDGHGGDKCSKFLKQSLDTILFNSPYFPGNIIESIKDAFQRAEQQFSQHAIKNGKLVDKSGSCALVALIINDICYAINLGDSRALYSKDSGKEFYQITRDHKPNDEKEKKRIEKMGGKVYYANKAMVNGVEVILKEEQFGKGFTFPYRLSPSGLAVSIYYLLII
jgi:protein phosphatase 2C family protein 2/3